MTFLSKEKTKQSFEDRLAKKAPGTRKQYNIVFRNFAKFCDEQMAELPIGKLLEALPTKLNPQKAAGADIVLGVQYTDIDEGYTLHVRNSILAVTSGFPNNPDMSLTLDSDTHKLIVGGHLTIANAMDSGQIELSGELDDLAEFFSMFDPLTVSATGTG